MKNRLLLDVALCAAVVAFAASAQVPPGPPGERPLVASGTVVDERGEPVAGARIYFQKLAPETEGGWIDIDDSSDPVRTDLKGRFAARAFMPAGGRFRICAEREGFGFDKPLRFEIGDKDIELEMFRSGTLAGKLILDPSVHASHLTLEVRPDLPPSPSGVEEQDLATRWSLEADGSFAAGPLKPGKYSVAIFASNDRDPLMRVEPVSVRGGEPSRDRRLQDVDFSKKLKGLKFHVVDKDGKAVPGTKAVIVPSAGGHVDATSNIVYTAADELIAILVRGESADVTILAPGHKRVRFKDVKTDQKVVLEKGIPVRLVLSGIRPPEPPLFLQAAIETEADIKSPEAEARRALGLQQGVDPVGFEPDGTVALTAPEAGKYHVLVTLVKLEKGYRVGANVPASGCEINVSSSMRGQDFKVSIAHQAFDDAKKRLE